MRVFAAAVFARRSGAGDAVAVEAARRAAGVASNNLEASLSRALQEPGRTHRRKLETMMAADAGLRRLGGALLALDHDTHADEGLATEEGWEAWSRWVPDALGQLAETDPSLPAPPPAPPAGTLARIGRVVEMLGDVVADRASSETVSRSGSGGNRAVRPSLTIERIGEDMRCEW